jgi:hypothetical protein
MIAQIDKNKLTMIALTIDPARNTDFFADLGLG